jgi:hypothetical protein
MERANGRRASVDELFQGVRDVKVLREWEDGVPVVKVVPVALGPFDQVSESRLVTFGVILSLMILPEKLSLG